jgi:hypothetical protein
MKTVEVVPRIDPRGIDYSWLHITRGQHADAIGSETETPDIPTAPLSIGLDSLLFSPFWLPLQLPYLSGDILS